MHGLAQDETLKNLYAGYAYQYARSLLLIAQAAGETAHIEPVTRRYIELTTSGAKADR